MKPIVEEFSYKEMSEEDISRFMREAEAMRAREIRLQFGRLFRAIGHAAVAVGHGFRNLIGNPGIHPTHGTR
jgi:hypothetical protein